LSAKRPAGHPAALSIAFSTIAFWTLARPAAADEPNVRECISANETAQDFRQTGRLREARRKLARCASASCPGPIRKDCAARLVEVEAATPTLVLEVRDAAGNDLNDVRVKSDGRPLADRLDGTPLAIDPGEHRLTFESPGMTPAEKTIIVHEGNKSWHERIALSVAPVVTWGEAGRPPAPSRAASATVEPPAGGSAPQPFAAARALANSIPPLAIVAFGVGAAGFALGIVTGIAAESKHGALEGECQMNGGCPASAQGDINGFNTLNTLSTVGYVVGAVALAGGLVLWIATPNGSASRASGRLWVGLHSAGFATNF
jgi:hypothetical protein